MLKAENLLGQNTKNAPTDGIYTIIPTGIKVYNSDGNVLENDNEFPTWLNDISTTTTDNGLKNTISVIALGFNAPFAKANESTTTTMYLPEGYSEKTDFSDLNEFVAYTSFQNVYAPKGILPEANIRVNQSEQKITEIGNDILDYFPYLQLDEELYTTDLGGYFQVSRLDTQSSFELRQDSSGVKSKGYYVVNEGVLFTNSDIGKEIPMQIVWYPE